MNVKDAHHSVSAPPAKEVRISPAPHWHKHAFVRTHARTHSVILSSTLVFYAPFSAAGDTACKARTLVNSPALILLTFAVTRRFAAWCCSTHSVTDEPPTPLSFASVETSLGAPAAHRSGLLARRDRVASKCQRTRELWGALASHYRRLNQAFMSVIRAPYTCIKAL